MRLLLILLIGTSYCFCHQLNHDVDIQGELRSIADVAEFPFSNIKNKKNYVWCIAHLAAKPSYSVANQHLDADTGKLSFAPKDDAMYQIYSGTISHIKSIDGSQIVYDSIKYDFSTNPFGSSSDGSLNCPETNAYWSPFATGGEFDVLINLPVDLKSGHLCVEPTRVCLLSPLFSSQSDYERQNAELKHNIVHSGSVDNLVSLASELRDPISEDMIKSVFSKSGTNRKASLEILVCHTIKEGDPVDEPLLCRVLGDEMKNGLDLSDLDAIALGILAAHASVSDVGIQSLISALENRIGASHDTKDQLILKLLNSS